MTKEKKEKTLAKICSDPAVQEDASSRAIVKNTAHLLLCGKRQGRGTWKVNRETSDRLRIRLELGISNRVLNANNCLTDFLS